MFEDSSVILSEFEAPVRYGTVYEGSKSREIYYTKIFQKLLTRVKTVETSVYKTELLLWKKARRNEVYNFNGK
jgi:hypothetical protein